MRNVKSLTKLFCIVISFLALPIFSSQLFVSQIQADWPTQCWENGCCGPSRVYNQWSCQQQPGLCRYWQIGQVEEWVCPTTGLPYGQSASLCDAACPDPVECQHICADGWASQCVIVEGSVPCSYPDPNTCTATIPSVICTSLNGGSDCSVSSGGSQSSGCWVNGPPPPNSSPPPTGSGTTCYRCVNSAACELTTSNAPCGCGACDNPRAKKVLFLFNDIDEDGVWDPGEKRISDRGDCVTSNTMQVPGAFIKVDGETKTDSCNVGESEYQLDACQDTYNCPNGSGMYWTPNAIQTVAAIGATCFAEQTCNCGAGCSWQGNCQAETQRGNICGNGATPSSYCTSGNALNLKSGPYNIVQKSTGYHSITTQLPAGWRTAAGAPTGANWVGTSGACEGMVGIGIVQEQTKWCKVTPVNVAMGTVSNNSIVMNVSGYSTGSNEQVVVTLTKKGPPHSSRILYPPGTPSPPPGTTESSFSGRYYYNVNNINCIAGSGNYCDKSFTVSGLPAGEYYAFCALNSANPNRCTGNPNCIHENLGGDIDCSLTNYESCFTAAAPSDPDDNAVITVTCNDTCTLACGQTNSCGVICPNTSGNNPPASTAMSDRDVIVTVPNTTPTTHYATFTWTAGLQGPGTSPASRYDLVIAKQSGGITNTATALQAWNKCSLDCEPSFTTCDTTFSDINNTPYRCVKHTNLNSLSYNYYPATNSNGYAIGNRVRFFTRAANLACISYPPATGTYSSFTNGNNYNLTQTISGTIYEDNGANGLPICGAPGETNLLAPPSGTTITESKSGDTLTFDGVASSYSFTGSVPYNPITWLGDKSEVQLTLPPPTDPANALVCACPNNGACQYSDISSPQTGLDFFLTTVDLSAEAWWQTVTGLVYAARDAIYSNIPDDCKNGTGTNPNCVPYLITQDATISDDSARALSAGIPMSGSDDVTGGSKTVWLTERVPQALTSEEIVHTQLLQEDFAYFQAKYDYANLPALNLPDDGSMPDISTDQVFKHTGDLTIQPNGNVWKLDSGQTLIIFVEGNLTFAGDFNTDDPLTDVTEGGFMAFIVDGSITFDANVGTADLTATTPTVEGVFIADQNITIDAAAVSTTKDKHFIGAGTFVAWAQNGTDGVVLNRNYQDGGLGGLDNRDYPTETFIFRPDFTLNIPDEMKSTSLFWQEVN